jgi:hypothetical protein
LTKRTRTRAVETEIDKIEQQGMHVAPVDLFTSLNHQQGFSGPKVIGIYMLICLAGPMILSGCVLLLGKQLGFVGWILIVLLYAVLYKTIKPNDVQLPQN